MSDQQNPRQPLPPEIPGKLHEIAGLLRSAHHLGPEAQQALAALADDLGNALDTAGPSTPESVHLVDAAAHLVEALHQGQTRGPLNAARQRLEELTARLEGQAPYGAAFARRLLDVLASLGI